MNVKGKYSKKEDEFIKNHYMNTSDFEIGRCLCRSEKSIGLRRGKLGLKKNIAKGISADEKVNDNEPLFNPKRDQNIGRFLEEWRTTEREKTAYELFCEISDEKKYLAIKFYYESTGHVMDIDQLNIYFEKFKMKIEADGDIHRSRVIDYLMHFNNWLVVCRRSVKRDNDYELIQALNRCEELLHDVKRELHICSENWKYL